MSAERFYKRFPASRRKWCVPVTSARPRETEESQRARAAGQESGDGPAPEGSGSAPVDLKSKRIKGVVEK
jgi:hypothetical protein